MPLDISRVDLLLQYALLIAGEEDEQFDRQLGPIHLIKYVYLADLAYAKRNNGETYTGLDWRFYKFGPWSQEVNRRIEPALLAIRADKQVFPSNYEDKEDWVRWCLRDDFLLREKEGELPPTIATHLKRDIHKYGKNTSELLHYVYSTKPMIYAAPNDYLDFSLAVDVAHANTPEPDQLKIGSLSAKKKKKFRERMSTLKDRHKSSGPKKAKLIDPVKNPRYDAVYEEGVLWLDNLAGEQLTSGEIVVDFSVDVWKSSTRKGEDVS